MIWDVILPRSRAFSLTINKTLKQFFTGLSFNDDFRDDADSILTNIDPALTNNLDKWEEQFYLRDTGLTVAERRARLAATWKMTGGQSPAYLQSVLQAFGFDVYVHDWWKPDDQTNYLAMGGDNAYMGADVAYMGAGFDTYPSAYDPTELLVSPYYPLVNKPVSVTPTIPTNPNTWRHFIYIAGYDMPYPGYVDPDRQEEFEELILSIFPAGKWIGMLIEYVEAPDGANEMRKLNQRYATLDTGYEEAVDNIKGFD